MDPTDEAINKETEEVREIHNKLPRWCKAILDIEKEVVNSDEKIHKNK